VSDESDSKVAEARAEALALARRQRAMDMRSVMATPSGRRFVWRYLNEMGVFGGSYAPGDALATAYNEGRRSAGLRLQADLRRLCAADYVRMHAEVMAQVELDAELMPDE